MKLNLKNQKGVNLIEIVVMMGVLMTVLSAVVVVTLNGLKNSQFAKNQLLATKLAQEGLDKVKLAKNKNCPVNVTTPSSVSYIWYGTGTLIWTATMNNSTPRTYKVDNLDQPSGCTLTQSDSDTSLSTPFSSTFKRVITIEDGNPPTLKKVTSEVSWVDLSGTHSSRLVTILSDK